MNLADVRAAALDVQFSTDIFADTVIYGVAPVLTQAGDEVLTQDDDAVLTQSGTGASIPAVINLEQKPDDDPGTTFESAEIIVLVSDVPDPQYRDKVVINGKTWRVRRIQSGDTETWTLKLFRDEAPVI